MRTPNKLLRLAREGLPQILKVLAYHARTETTPERREASITYVTEEKS